MATNTDPTIHACTPGLDPANHRDAYFATAMMLNAKLFVGDGETFELLQIGEPISMDFSHARVSSRFSVTRDYTSTPNRLKGAYINDEGDAV